MCGKNMLKKTATRKLYYLSICLLVLSPVGVKICVGECVRIPTYSMYPTLLPGDIAWCEKITYGPILPERISELPIINLLCFFPFIQQLDKQMAWKRVRLAGIRPPKRLDVVVFDSPGEQTMLTKRVIGLPGDTFSIQKGKIYINGKRLIQLNQDIYCYRTDSITYPKIMRRDWTTTNYGPLIIPYKGMQVPYGEAGVYQEVIDNEQMKVTIDSLFVFTDDYYFMLGDNGNNSLDSRFIGLIPARNIKGRLSHVLYSDIASFRERFLKKID